MSTTLYLKYRPQQLQDIVGQENIKKTLSNASKNSRFAHAYLFSGPRGCGKTSTARILATLLSSDGMENEEEIRKSILNQSCPDVIELDGAKHRKVEDINEVIESAQFGPSHAKNKVFIIDECHQLSSTAISALLKIIEEPPEYLYFIFCTTEYQKIPDTILSRVQKHFFSFLKNDQIVKHLKYICEQEGVDSSEEGLLSIASMGEGSMRDSINLLDQVISTYNRIQFDEVQNYFGVSKIQGISKLVDLMINIKATDALQMINNLYCADMDAISICKDLSEAFRQIMLNKAKCQEGASKSLNFEQDLLDSWSKEVSLNALLEICSVFSDIYQQLEYNINVKWVMETIIIKCIKILRK